MITKIAAILALLPHWAECAAYSQLGPAPERMDIGTYSLRAGSTLWHGDKGWLKVVRIKPGSVWVVPC